ncbi:MAG: hypothetical protein QOF41_1838 [Methylobacteriaceae bacterium]|nr:hypothetical protein [Methylobacteriaceae bacterium]
MVSTASLRRYLHSALFSAAVLFCGHVYAGQGVTSRNDFRTEAEAARHCRGRPVVWVVPRDRSYFVKGDREYGTAAGGAYMCEDDAKGDQNRRASGTPRPPQ